MATFDWKTATTDEKLEQLKTDIERAFEVLNRLNNNDASLEANLRGVKQTLGEVCRAVDALEKKKSYFPHSILLRREPLVSGAMYFHSLTLCFVPVLPSTTTSILNSRSIAPRQSSS